MSTADPLLTAVERLRASVDALPEPLREPWIVEGSLTNAVVRTEDGSYVVSTGDEYSIAAHIAAWSPAAVLRWLSWAEQVAARHVPEETDSGPWCNYCNGGYGVDWPCPDLRGLAGALGLEET